MEENLKYWIGLNLLFSENLRMIQILEGSFTSVAEIFSTGVADLKNVGVDEDKAVSLSSGKILEEAEEQIAALQKRGYRVLTRDEPLYPACLREVFDPPRVLYCAGDPAVLESPMVAIVGSRRPSPYGRAVAENIAHELAQRGIVVVSGMARGIDSMAHWGALKQGRTVAVLGSGLDFIYPKENRPLSDKIKENGAVITEFPLRSPPLGFHFPLRNRIISGLSQAVVVVEATRKSGSLITARLALEHNREVMAVPGNITSELSRGSHWLIKAGATLVEDWRDIVAELQPEVVKTVSDREAPKPPERPELTPSQRRLYDLLESDQLTHIDTLVEKSGLSVSEVLTQMLDLELKGWVFPSPGKYYQRKM